MRSFVVNHLISHVTMWVQIFCQFRPIQSLLVFLFTFLICIYCTSVVGKICLYEKQTHFVYDKTRNKSNDFLYSYGDLFHINVAKFRRQNIIRGFCRVLPCSIAVCSLCEFYVSCLIHSRLGPLGYKKYAIISLAESKNVLLHAYCKL